MSRPPGAIATAGGGDERERRAPHHREPVAHRSSRAAASSRASASSRVAASAEGSCASARTSREHYRSMK